MKRFILLILLGGMFALSSCLDVLEELTINKDGTGKYSLTFDMSALFTDPFMKSIVDQAMEEEGGLSGQIMEIDSIISFKDAPDSVRQKFDNPEFWDKVVMRVTVSEKQEKMMTVMELNFEDIKDIEYFYDHLNELGDEGGFSPTSMMGGSSELFAAAPRFKLEKKKLTRLPSTSPPKPEDDENGEELEFLKMFMSGASYKTIYHLPAKVRKTTISKAEVKGNTVTVDIPYLDLMEGKAKMDGEIRF
jgi:hypothetical protein